MHAPRTFRGLFGRLLREAASATFFLTLGALAPISSSCARGHPATAVSEIKASELPAEAHLTLRLIRQGGPFPYRRDGVEFQNRENRLPRRPHGYYREYTVPTPGENDRGARRIVTGIPMEYYYTDDHYRSFRRIQP